MGYWYDDRHDDEYSWDDLDVDVHVTENPIVDVIYGPDGGVLLAWRARPEIGFR